MDEHTDRETLGHDIYCTSIASTGKINYNFGLIRFGFQSQVLGFGFFSFGILTPPQCKSILVCENTKMESINFHKSFN